MRILPTHSDPEPVAQAIAPRTMVGRVPLADYGRVCTFSVVVPINVPFCINLERLGFNDVPSEQPLRDLCRADLRFFQR